MCSDYFHTLDFTVGSYSAMRSAFYSKKNVNTIWRNMYHHNILRNAILVLTSCLRLRVRCAWKLVMCDEMPLTTTHTPLAEETVPARQRSAVVDDVGQRKRRRRQRPTHAVLAGISVGDSDVVAGRRRSAAAAALRQSRGVRQASGKCCCCSIFVCCCTLPLFVCCFSHSNPRRYPPQKKCRSFGDLTALSDASTHHQHTASHGERNGDATAAAANGGGPLANGDATVPRPATAANIHVSGQWVGNAIEDVRLSVVDSGRATWLKW